MIRLSSACLAFGLLTTPVFAADTKVADAVKTFEQVAADPAKVKAYCDMNKIMNDAGDDEQKAQAAEPQIDALMKVLGPEVEAALSTGDGLDEKSPDFQTYDEAISKLDEKCQ